MVEVTLGLLVRLMADALPVWVMLGVMEEQPEAKADVVKLCDAVTLPVTLPQCELVSVSVIVGLGDGEADLRALALEEEQGVLLGEMEGERERRGEELDVKVACEGEAVVLGLVVVLPVR